MSEVQNVNPKDFLSINTERGLRGMIFSPSFQTDCLLALPMEIARILVLHRVLSLGANPHAYRAMLGF